MVLIFFLLLHISLFDLPPCCLDFDFLKLLNSRIREGRGSSVEVQRERGAASVLKSYLTSATHLQFL